MTVDYLASIVANAIDEDIAIYDKAVSNHAAENVSEDRRKALYLEFWALELAILDVVLPLKPNLPPIMGNQLVAMLVVGYSPLDKNNYLDRLQYYASALSSAPANEFTISLAKAFG